MLMESYSWIETQSQIRDSMAWRRISGSLDRSTILASRFCSLGMFPSTFFVSEVTNCCQIPAYANPLQHVDDFLQDPTISLHGSMHGSMGCSSSVHSSREELYRPCSRALLPRRRRGTVLSRRFVSAIHLLYEEGNCDQDIDFVFWEYLCYIVCGVDCCCDFCID
jgi:hypothetical protein